MEMTELLRPFITLLVVIDPIGTIPVFIHAVHHIPKRLHRTIAIRAVLIAGMVLTGFLLVGQLLIEALGLRLAAFEISGGIILFLFAMQMMFGPSKPQAEIAESRLEDEEYLSTAAFPLAMPSIASPGAILAVVVLTDYRVVSVGEQAVIGGLLYLALFITLLLLFFAGRIHHVIGTTGASVVSRVMGTVLATIALEGILRGVESLGVMMAP